VLRSSVFRIVCGSRLLTTPRVDLAQHIVGTKRDDFEPEKFEDQYEDALKELLSKKQKGEKIERPKRAYSTNVVEAEENRPALSSLSRTQRPRFRSRQLAPLALIYAHHVFAHLRN
jgi:non-homologous end joining protein Ku